MKCRVCSNEDLDLIIDMGNMPLANSFTIDGECDKYPLQVCYCDNCSLLQVANDVNPDILFKNYPYRSSVSKPLADHFYSASIDVTKITKSNDLICEIGSNDGVFLSNFINSDRRIIGIDPAKNFKTEFPTVCEYFDTNVASTISSYNGKAKVIFAANVLAHVSDLHETVKAAKMLLSDDGFFILEVHSLNNLLQYCCYDQIYHEHRCYFSIKSLETLMEMYDLEITGIRFFKIHGWTSRLICKHKSNKRKKITDPFIKEESIYINKKTIEKFSKDVIDHKYRLSKMIQDLKSENKTIGGYGAPAKCNTLLNFLHLNNDDIDYIIDSTPEKQGMKTPETKIPIYDRPYLNDNPLDYLLMFCWNYENHVIQKESELLKTGTSFIVPFPSIHVR